MGPGNQATCYPILDACQTLLFGVLQVPKGWVHCNLWSLFQLVTKLAKPFFFFLLKVMGSKVEAKNKGSWLPNL